MLSFNEAINEDNEESYKINEEYVLFSNNKIGSGSFGKIYKCKNIKTKEIFAAKVEELFCANPQLIQEAKILTQMKGKFGFPFCYKIINTKQEKIMVMDFLGPNLEEIMQKMSNQKYSMKTALMIAQQMITRLKDLHTSGFIHRDLKPENFVIGKPNKERTIYLIDYGLAKKYINDKTKDHIPFKEGRPILGTARYISMNAHLGNEQSRRDDLESIGYIMIYFILGELPWQGQKCRTKREKYDKLFEKKKATVPNELCKFLPEEIKTYFQYILSLSFEAKPDYNYLLKLLDTLMTKLGYSNDLQFDWYNPSCLTILYEQYNKANKEKENEKIIQVNPKNVAKKKKQEKNGEMSAKNSRKTSCNKLTYNDKLFRNIDFEKENKKSGVSKVQVNNLWKSVSKFK